MTGLVTGERRVTGIINSLTCFNAFLFAVDTYLRVCNVHLRFVIFGYRHDGYKLVRI